MNHSRTTIFKMLNQEFERLQEEYSVESLGIFGSYLRNEKDSGSDLDLLVTFSDPPTLLQFVRLKNHLSDLLGIPVDLVMKKALKPKIGEQVLKEVVAIFCSSLSPTNIVFSNKRTGSSMHGKILLTVLIAASCFFTGCAKNSDHILSSTLIEESLQLSIPERDHGYRSFSTKTIANPDSLQRFIAQVQAQQSWHKKQLFLTALQDSILNLSEYDLVLFRVTEGSGSTMLTIRGPYMLDSIIFVKIDRNVPSLRTADEANYCFAYRVPKKYKKMIFEVDGIGTTILQLY